MHLPDHLRSVPAAAGDDPPINAATPPAVLARVAIDSTTADRQRAGERVPWTDPDFVDHVFDYLLREFPELAGPRFARAKRAVRAHLGGERPYIAARRAEGLAAEVLARFNGRNATEVARSLNISRATVYRYLKQPGKGDER